MNHERDLVGSPGGPPAPSAQPAWLLEEAYAGLSGREAPGRSGGPGRPGGGGPPPHYPGGHRLAPEPARGGTLRAPRGAGYLAPHPGGVPSLCRGGLSPRCWRCWRPGGVLRPYGESMTMPAAWLGPNGDAGHPAVSTTLLTSIPGVTLRDRPNPTGSARAHQEPGGQAQPPPGPPGRRHRPDPVHVLGENPRPAPWPHRTVRSGSAGAFRRADPHYRQPSF